eukprot:CAMPEP_0172820114 /NCGR_PEP_ID=MMETSP1075-20121228/15043_1 /TAXON_ID=2916 /ORGANISM="Ceratium fusus, Strain PA161109" /LENGTH=432 /DNA_ID=CAMNT_0013660737 /DNA_START=552 /DNA_END=1847 /DNA_ORIENTATION=+
MEICSDAQAQAAHGSAVGKGTWNFGNWTAYYQYGHWDSRCFETCKSVQITRVSAQRGAVSLGHARTGVYYAPGSRCSWLIEPDTWLSGSRLEVQFIFRSIAARGDTLWLHHAIGSVPGDVIGSAGCPLDASQTCIMGFRATVSAPVIVTFNSGYPSRTSTSAGGIMQVDWGFDSAYPFRPVVRPSSSSSRIPSNEGSGLSSFIWVAMASMLLMPLLVMLLCMGWRWRRRSPNGARNAASSGFDSRRQQAVDIEAMERELANCRPRIIGNSETGEAEQDSNKICSVCLAGFEEGEEVRSLPCNHNFHRSCIDTWLARSGMCPLCRSALPRRMVLPNAQPVLASSSRSPRTIGSSSMASRPFTTQLRGSAARGANARPPTGGGVVRPSSIGSVTRGLNDRSSHVATSAPAAGTTARAQVTAAGREPVGMRTEQD